MPNPHTSVDQAARRLSSALTRLARVTSPPLVVATVADVSTHLTLGYVTATIGKGPVVVYGIPLGTVVPGMRITVKSTDAGVQRSWTFVSFAPQPAAGPLSGSLLVTSGLGTSAAATAAGTFTTIQSAAHGPYVSFFYYTPTLPAPGSHCDLFQLRQLSGTQGSVTGYFTDTGQIGFVLSDGAGTTVTYTSANITISPHQIWHIVFMPGPGSASYQPIQVNGYRYKSDGVTSYWSSTATTAVTGNFTSAQLWLMNNAAGQFPCPIGSWISKFTYGASAVGNLPTTPIGVKPLSDAAIPNGRATLGQGVFTTLRYLMNSNVGTGTLTDTGAAGLTLTVNTAAAAVASIGPY